MKTAYEIINEDKFSNVIELNIEELTTDGKQFIGSVHLKIKGEAFKTMTFKTITGYHGANDYLSEYGFKLIAITISGNKLFI